MFISNSFQAVHRTLPSSRHGMENINCFRNLNCCPSHRTQIFLWLRHFWNLPSVWCYWNAMYDNFPKYGPTRWCTCGYSSYVSQMQIRPRCTSTVGWGSAGMGCAGSRLPPTAGPRAHSAQQTYVGNAHASRFCYCLCVNGRLSGFLSDGFADDRLPSLCLVCVSIFPPAPPFLCSFGND